MTIERRVQPLQFARITMCVVTSSSAEVGKRWQMCPLVSKITEELQPDADPGMFSASMPDVLLAPLRLKQHRAQGTQVLQELRSQYSIRDSTKTRDIASG